ncbi:MAG: PKD domain-containing protein [Actinobacteria bacterium]|nr:PKD domain-containing protein [Actinomycetota bacterium]
MLTDRRRAATTLAVAATVLLLLAPASAGATGISGDEVRDRIRGAWAGGIAAAAWGFPVEFDYTGRIVPRARVPRLTMRWINRYTFRNRHGPDETYVEVPFLDALSRDPLAGWAEWGPAFRDTSFRLYSANLRGRQNLRAGLAPPASGDPDHNPYAYNIDFQIEADFAGLVAPAQPGAAVDIAWRAGHVMNHGDGVYGGVMVAAMTARAFRARGVREIVRAGRLAVPAGSSYRAMIEDVIRWHRKHPRSWIKVWKLVERRWNAHRPEAKRDPRHVRHEFNIDAKLNGAYILLGLLYGRGEYERTVRIALRAGQDTDCNPANAGSIIGAWRGHDGLPARFTRGLRQGDNLPETDYTLRRAIRATLDAARGVTLARGGAPGRVWEIADSPLVTPLVERWPLTPTEPPQLQASASVSGRVASFTAQAQDLDGIGAYWWSFGDLDSAPGAAPVHAYRVPGSYTATVWAADSDGRTSAVSVPVEVPG